MATNSNGIYAEELSRTRTPTSAPHSHGQVDGMGAKAASNRMSSNAMTARASDERSAAARHGRGASRGTPRSRQRSAPCCRGTRGRRMEPKTAMAPNERQPQPGQVEEAPKRGCRQKHRESNGKLSRGAGGAAATERRRQERLLLQGLQVRARAGDERGATDNRQRQGNRKRRRQRREAAAQRGW